MCEKNGCAHHTYLMSLAKKEKKELSLQVVLVYRQLKENKIKRIGSVLCLPKKLLLTMYLIE